MNQSVRIQYCAILREQRGLAWETLATPAATPADLYAELRARHGFSLPASRLQVAINGDFAAWDTGLRAGDEIIFLPPFAGG